MRLKPKKRCSTPAPTKEVTPVIDTTKIGQIKKFREVGRLWYQHYGECALRGRCISVEEYSEEVVDRLTYYMLGVLSASYAPGTFAKFSESAGFSVLNDRIKKVKGVTVTHIYTCTLYGMPCIGYVLRGKDIVEPFTEDYGSGYPCATCYVFNPIADECSEFGDCFFEQRMDGYHRVS